MKARDIVTTAQDRMKLAADADRENRDRAMDDLRNLVGDQWPEKLRLEREADGQLCVVINRLPQFLRQVTGDIRNMNPAITVLPASGGASKESAEVYEGLVRHIQYRSDASSVYEWAGESAAACSMGYFRILTEYEEDDSFNQEILIKPIRNAFSVYFDPEAREPCRSDAGWCFITSIMAEDDFKNKYPGKAMTDAEADGATDYAAYWRDGSDVIVAEYFWKEPVKRTLSMMQDGAIVEGKAAGAIKTREVQTHKVMWAKVSGGDVLEGPQEWAGKHIPVVAVVGEEMHVGDKVVRTSVIRYAKEPARLYNYFMSAETEMVALQPKAPFLVTPKQIQGFETFWNEANRSNRPYLPYNIDEKAGRPERVQPPMSSSGMVQHIMMAADDMQATTGIYDAGLGQKSNEKSGVAIRQRQLESDVSTSIYSDNVGKAVAQCGRIIVDLIPKIYDTQRAIRIVGSDDEERVVDVNVPLIAQGQEQIWNDLTVGRYDIRVAIGPNYTTKRQATAENMLEFIRVFPAAAQVTGDLVAESMDWPNADRFADRLKKTLPPGIISQEDLPENEQQNIAAQQEQQAQQQQMAEGMAQLAVAEAQAKTAQAEAQARKAQAEATKAEMEVAAMAATIGLSPTM